MIMKMSRDTNWILFYSYRQRKWIKKFNLEIGGVLMDKITIQTKIMFAHHSPYFRPHIRTQRLKPCQNGLNLENSMKLLLNI